MYVNKRYNLLKQERVIFLRTVKALNDFWRFTKLPAGMNISKDNIISPEYEDASWQPVVLPHTYNSEDGALPNLILYHTEDDNIERRKALYTAEGRLYYKGNLYVPDDLECIELDKEE